MRWRLAPWPLPALQGCLSAWNRAQPGSRSWPALRPAAALSRRPFLPGADAGKRKGIVMTDRTERAPSAFRLNLEQQKNRAKELLRAAKAGDAAARSRLAAVHDQRDVRRSLAGAKSLLNLADAQLAIARELRFPSWAQLKSHVHSMDQQLAA